MRLRDLKDALKGTRKRLERAEALLEDTLVHIQSVYDLEADGYTTGKLHAKIDKFFKEPLDSPLD